MPAADAPIVKRPPRGRRRVRLALALLLASSFLVLGMSGQEMPVPDERMSATGKHPVVVIDPVTGASHTFVSVLIFNVADDPWPVSWRRAGAMDTIGARLAAWRLAGNAPDVVLLQEAFTPKSIRLGQRAGYANWMGGPGADDPAVPLSGREHEAFIEGRAFWKGETLGKMVSSGLFAFSDYPVLDRITQPFGQHACAGYDCLANKGMMMIRVAVPGVPAPLDIVTTHLNSRRSSGVPDERSLYAHSQQVDELAAFLKQYHDPAHPLLFGGDFNIRDSPARLSHTLSSLSYPFVGAYCSKHPGTCTTSRRPGTWYESEDQQGFESTKAIQVRPVSAQVVFDQPVDGRKLSDHDGYLVVYRIDWSGPAHAATLSPGRQDFSSHANGAVRGHGGGVVASPSSAR